jgi:threonine synthase
VEYISTRGLAPVLNFEDVMLAGLARDGGLYVPKTWPQFSAEQIANFAFLPYEEVAFAVLRPFIDADLDDETLLAMIFESYATFRAEDVAPMRSIDGNHWLCELYHGPTLAFKDVAMQILARLMDHALKKQGRRATIVGATSGDTGSAAIAAFQACEEVDIFILHPDGRVSDVQRRQMTTIVADNVHNIAIEGTFDDCQNLVKELFNDHDFRDEVNLSGVNSINWARVMAQIVYYFTSAVKVGAPESDVSFSVPTGNFGDIFAGYAARQMGLPIEKLVIATNVNDILCRVLETGKYAPAGVVPTSSPSMDIQISSNFERLVFDLYNRDSTKLRTLMENLKQDGEFELSPSALEEMRTLFVAERVDEEQTAKVIEEIHEHGGDLVDPHTAVGIAAGERHVGATAMISLATAHPAKFPDAVKAASGATADLPEELSDLMEREERYDVLGNDLEMLQEYIEARVRL